MKKVTEMKHSSHGDFSNTKLQSDSEVIAEEMEIMLPTESRSQWLQEQLRINLIHNHKYTQ